ncbi:thiamine phosphate synthase [Variovorax sp. PBS-H4]|uniref:thiamine phosphate synthase n=1 Tax=Variovorax sp. PBS-H4 TaxID=434008 RepID=UPI0013A53179|nr:thiamine phosphate synthase [Variovorax sp. PBS-H4]
MNDPTNHRNDPDGIARAIVEAHAARFGEAGGRPASFSSDDAVYRGAKTACAALGFIEVDAECLACAWQAQTRRTGAFDAGAWPEHPADFGMRPFPLSGRDDAFPPCPERLGLYAVLPDAAWVGRMARAGVPTVQLRFKSADAEAVKREVHAAVDAVRGTGALLFINDHWQDAVEARAYGLHLGQEDLDALDPQELQAIRASGIRLGVSTHGYAEMVRADAVSPSYIAMGAVYPTTLKQMATAPQGVARLAAYARLMRGYPQVGIGGVDAQRLSEVLATGVGSVAVVRAVVAEADPEAAAARLMKAMAAG